MALRELQNKNWHKTKLGDILKLKYGFALQEKYRKPGTVPVYGSSGIVGYTNEPMTPPRTIIVGRKGNVGSVYFSTEACYPIDTVYYIDPRDTKADPKFLYYFLQKMPFKQIGSDVGVPGLNRDIAYGLDVQIPVDIDNQKRIANVLSVFDDKIELNDKISQDLEKAVHAIFKEWFLKFKFPGYEKMKIIDSEMGKIPEGWIVKKLGDLADVQWGDTSITKSSYIKDGYSAYSASGQDGFRKIYDFDRVGVVLSAIGANCGLTWLARDKWSVIKNTIRFWSISKEISTEYLFLVTNKKEVWPQRGSAQPFITIGDARKINILIPEANILAQFNNFIVAAYSEIDVLRLENRKLASFRDLLLPKLMSGEIKV